MYNFWTAREFQKALLSASWGSFSHLPLGAGGKREPSSAFLSGESIEGPATFEQNPDSVLSRLRLSTPSIGVQMHATRETGDSQAQSLGASVEAEGVIGPIGMSSPASSGRRIIWAAE